MGIGERIRQKRGLVDMTAKELSEKSGVPEKTIYRIETSKVIDPKISSIKPIIEALGCSADDLIMDSKNNSLSGLLKDQFERTAQLPIKEKAQLIQIIDRWVNSVNTEKLYLKTLSTDELEIEDHDKKISEDKFNELVKNEFEFEMHEKYEKYLETIK